MKNLTKEMRQLLKLWSEYIYEGKLDHLAAPMRCRYLSDDIDELLAGKTSIDKLIELYTPRKKR